EFLASGVLCLKDDATQKPNGEPDRTPVEKAIAFAGMELFIPEKNENKDRRWQNDVQLQRYDGQETREQGFFVQGDQCSNIANISADNPIVQFKDEQKCNGNGGGQQNVAYRDSSSEKCRKPEQST